LEHDFNLRYGHGRFASKRSLSVIAIAVSSFISILELLGVHLKKALLSFLLLLCPFFLRAQVANNTSLVGTVTDSSGSVIAGATVTGINEDTKVHYSGTTNAEGYYAIPFIAPGTYDISVEQAGFQKTISKGVTVQLNVAARTDVTLSVGSANTEVTVTAATPALSTDDALIGETIDQAKVTNLPLASRRAMDLAATASNIIIGPKTSFTGNPPGANYIGAGTREVTNSLTLDGITIMNSLTSSSPVTPNPDAISAVQTQTGNYTAQYGAYMGVHINMDTKRGTNDLHGTGYWFFRNRSLNARAQPSGRNCSAESLDHLQRNRLSGRATRVGARGG